MWEMMVNEHIVQPFTGRHSKYVLQYLPLSEYLPLSTKAAQLVSNAGLLRQTIDALLQEVIRSIIRS